MPEYPICTCIKNWVCLCCLLQYQDMTHMKKNVHQLVYDAFLRSFKRNIDVPHSILLGAGASISSDIQSAYDCIWEWKKDIYLSKNVNVSDYYKNYKDEAVRRSIQNWLDSQGEYPKIDSPVEYSFYAEKAYPIAEDRRKYFMSLAEGKEPYIGYDLICLLAEHGIIKAVWTTNFDGLMVRAAHQNRLIPIEINLDNPDKIFRNQSSKEFPIIALHGDYKFSKLKNTDKELDSQNEIFSQRFRDYHIDKNLIVLGYSGRDCSLMNTLENAFTQRGTGRLYWCGYGDNVSDNVVELIEKIRKSGREAYYVPTDGFDKTIIHLSKTAFEENKTKLNYIHKKLEMVENEEFFKTEFELRGSKTDKYIKSNLHPIVFPKEVFQFEINYKNEKPWSFLRSKTKDTNICAVPFKKKVFTFGTLSEIHATFKDSIVSEIKREPISKSDIEKVGSFRQLMLQVILKYFSTIRGIESNYRDRLWLTKPYERFLNVNIHKSVFLSFYFDRNSQFAYLAFIPTIYLSSNDEIHKSQKQNISKKQIEKLYNNKYDELLEYWNRILFAKPQLIFEFPIASGTGFYFKISASTAFGEINVIDPNFSSDRPQGYITQQTQFRGAQFLEPQLVFKNTHTNNDAKDYHPMRGLINNKPYDANLNGMIYANEINLSVICSKPYSQALYLFLNGLHQQHKTDNVNPDYLIDFPGFSKAFNISMNIPYYENEEKWIDIYFEARSDWETHRNAIDLARLITTKIERIANTQNKNTIVIFIPNEWQPFETYINNGESFDLHDYIKAFSASRGISTQLIREDTLHDNLKCQIYWWLSLSFYVKDLRTPWILNNQEKNTAYAGIGYSITKIKDSPEIVIGCSHIYDSNGQGLKYRLSKVDDYYLDKQNNPYLSYNDAFQFGVSIRELFYQSLDKLPDRVVIHKRTRFTDDEINGLKDSLNKAGIKRIDLIEINYDHDARFLAMTVKNKKLQIDNYPISRGTCIVTNKFNALLWTHGIVPSVRRPNWRYYLGGRSIPAPIRITKHYGDSNISTIATEILALTKMNWNSLDLYSKLPSTIDSSNQIARIGKLLSRFEGKTYDYRLFI